MSDEAETRGHTPSQKSEPKYLVDHVVALRRCHKDTNDWTVIGHWYSNEHGAYVYNLRHSDGSERTAEEHEIA